MSVPFAYLNLLAFYEIARRANLTNHPDLLGDPRFQEARELYEEREKYLHEGFGNNPEAIDDYFRLRLEGALTRQDKRWEDVWAEFAPDSLTEISSDSGGGLPFATALRKGMSAWTTSTGV